MVRGHNSRSAAAPSAQCDSEFLLHALANGPLARGPLLDSAAKLGCKPENLHRPRAGFGMAAKPEPLEVD